jgi:hypothetical protein
MSNLIRNLTDAPIYQPLNTKVMDRANFQTFPFYPEEEELDDFTELPDEYEDDEEEDWDGEIIC